VLSLQSCSGIRPDNDTPRGKQVHKLIELTLTALGKITAAITLGSSSETPIIKTTAIQQRFERIQAKIQEAIASIADTIKPGGGFAENCDKLQRADSKMTPVHIPIILPDGLVLGIDLEIITDGYTPAMRDLAEVVDEAMDPVLTEIEEIWAEDGASIDEIAGWRTSAEQRMQHGLGFNPGELVGSAIGGSGSEGSGIQEHRSDASLD
jgi:hypothetical protein